MPRREPLQITMKAREVIARDAPFRPWDKSFADEGVARDEISSLSPRVEPLLLRVTATGGALKSRLRVVGDWFCDVAGEGPKRIPSPQWSHSTSSLIWSRSRTWIDAWESCPDPRWLLHEAGSVGVDLRLVVLAACACVKLAVRLIPRDEPRPMLAVEAAEAWARGGPRPDPTYGEEADDASVLLAQLRGGAGFAATAASHVADAAYWHAAGPASSIKSAALAADAAADALGDEAYDATGADTVDASEVAAAEATRKANREMVKLVRRSIPTATVLRALTGNGGGRKGSPGRSTA